MILCLDDTGLGLLLTDYPLSQEGLEYARYRPRKVGRILRWDRVYRYRHIIRRISLMPIRHALRPAPDAYVSLFP